MKTFEDMLTAKAAGENALQEFIFQAINEYKCSDMYHTALTAYEYFCKRNVTIRKYQKLLYTLSGETVPDNYSANFKLTNAFFHIFVEQENKCLLGNGVTFQNPETKQKLGGDIFDSILQTGGEYALWGGVSYGFWNVNKPIFFKATEFVPLFGEEDGALHAGIRFWQIDYDKPLRATFFDETAYTEYIWRVGKNAEILQPKRPYQQIVKSNPAGDIEIFDGQNYPGFPVIPLWGNQAHQSELVGIREMIDAYDLIQSGFANDLDDASQIYWTIQNAGGMDDIDLAKFVERMKTIKAAVIDENGSTAEAHTLDLPYLARQTGLDNLKSALYRNAMALNVDDLNNGNMTATAIQASYENLNLKCDSYEFCVIDFIKALLNLLGIDDTPNFKRDIAQNQPEQTQMVLSAAQYLDDETILKHLPFLSPDEIPGILERRKIEEMTRYESETEESEENGGTMDGQAT